MQLNLVQNRKSLITQKNTLDKSLQEGKLINQETFQQYERMEQNLKSQNLQVKAYENLEFIHKQL